MLRCLLFLTLLLSAVVAAPAARAQDAVHRCTAMDGETVYTDKKCEDVGAMDRLPRITPEGSTSSTGLYRGTCSRTLSDLVYQITAAVDAHDVNRLAGVYDWSGVSDAGANRVLDQLEAVVNRPLVDIAPVRPAQPVTDPLGGNVVDANSDGYYPQTNSQRPIGLRLEQTLKNSATPSRTVFGLRRSYKCFWITL
ncbi:hypothetical protein [Pseudoxanthomonas indica]|uniref:DUF4124 domain-containing protein n=1 Tax=Pseudoxanthomonas indica TaxID=428993 RepID=A0A1T5JR66_9GAMM|nr:hypothetical protein [Pseudoxanthomonas indica]GGD43849.1 hypothetical protein GCM10007235_14770 [Pseudoxanthomonas indica]SKC53795.1 hypothetical protein SAMN06296058_1016 [Pseudoxanthomonas indica]